MAKQKIFNKKNLINFANDLYQEKGNTIYYRPLCTNELAKANGEITCCVLGEMYEYFEGKPVFNWLSAKQVKEVYFSFLTEDEFKETHDPSYSLLVDEDEYNIAYNLAQRASINEKIKKEYSKKEYSKEAFLENDVKFALRNLENDVKFALRNEVLFMQSINDQFSGMTQGALISRAKRCKNALLKIADKYLK